MKWTECKERTEKEGLNMRKRKKDREITESCDNRKKLERLIVYLKGKIAREKRRVFCA